MVHTKCDTQLCGINFSDTINLFGGVNIFVSYMTEKGTNGYGFCRMYKMVHNIIVLKAPCCTHTLCFTTIDTVFIHHITQWFSNTIL